MDVTAPLYSLSDTAAVAGLTPAYVRRLFADYRVASMAAPSPKRSALKACLLDVLRLRILRVLRDAGLSEQNAIYVLDLAVDPVLGGMAGCGIPVEYAFLRERLADRLFYVVLDECDEPPDVFSLPAGSPITAYAQAALAVHLEPILAAVNAGLTQTAGSPASESKS